MSGAASTPTAGIGDVALEASRIMSRARIPGLNTLKNQAEYWGWILQKTAQTVGKPGAEIPA